MKTQEELLQFYIKEKDKRKRWISAQRSAHKQLVELHQEEYDIIFAAEKNKVGIKDRKVKF
jgi:hypothetical protein